MLIAKVIGTTVSTIKDEMLTGRKLLILRQTDETALRSANHMWQLIHWMPASVIWY